MTAALVSSATLERRGNTIPWKRAVRRFVALVALGMLSSCYVYVPVRTLEPQVGTRVAAELTGYGSDSLAGAAGPGIATVRGDVISTERSAVILSVASVTDVSGRDQFWKGEPLRVPRVAVRNLQQREFSLGRSLLLGAAVVGTSVATWQAFNGGTRGGMLPGGGGGGAPK